MAQMIWKTADSVLLDFAELKVIVTLAQVKAPHISGLVCCCPNTLAIWEKSLTRCEGDGRGTQTG